MPEHWNTITEQQLCGDELLPLFYLLQVDAFQEKQGMLQRIKLCPSNNPKIACIRRCDTDNSTQSLSRMYYHNATESLYCLRGVKDSWTPNLAEVLYQFGLICFSICLQCKICRSSVFLFFPHKVSNHKVRKVMDPSFWKKYRSARLGGLKKSQSKVFKVLAKMLST